MGPCERGLLAGLDAASKELKPVDSGARTAVKFRDEHPATCRPRRFGAPQIPASEMLRSEEKHLTPGRLDLIHKCSVVKVSYH